MAYWHKGGLAAAQDPNRQPAAGVFRQKAQALHKHPTPLASEVCSVAPGQKDEVSRKKERRKARDHVLIRSRVWLDAVMEEWDG